MKLTFTEDFINEIKEKNDIVEIAKEYFDLVYMNGSWKACCKHEGGDKTPSLTFFPNTQSFYCFSCQAGKRGVHTEGSDLISFIQWVENLNWQDALIFLANKSNIPIPKSELTTEDKQKLALFEATLQENRTYWSRLYSNKFIEIKNWFYARNIEDQDITKWRLGADIQNDKLVPVYTIVDEYGRSVSFSKRIGEKGSKYVNGKTSPIFKKGNILYGLHHIKKEVRIFKFIILVEGYNDVILCQKYGVPAVATMGTSLSLEQIKLIKKYVNRVILFRDGDQPGIDSTIENIKVLKQENIEVEVINITGFDPDEVAIKYKEKTLDFILKHKKLAFQFLINNVLNKYFDNVLRLKKETLKQLEEIFEYIEDETEKKMYKDQIIKAISMEERERSNSYDL